MIVLLRHARTSGGAGRCIGRTDLNLSPAGLEEAEKVASEFHTLGFTKLYTSPSLRAKATLAPLSKRLNIEPEVVPSLDEIDMGEWDGLSFSDIQMEYPDAYVQRGLKFGSFRAPGGETFNEVAERAYSTLLQRGFGQQHILAVTHAGVIRSLLCRLTRHPMDMLFDFKPENIGCTVLAASGTTLELGATDLTLAMVKPYLETSFAE